MKITKLVGKGNDLVVELNGVTFSQMNMLRRVMMNEVPVMAIEHVEFKKNNGILYDEMLALRLGLVPLTTDLKAYNLPAECSCEGAGCAKCQIQFTLEAKGPTMALSGALKGKDPKVKPVLTEMPLVLLLEGQEVELVATAQLGLGKDHAKWSAGLVYYRQKPSLKIGNVDAKEVIKTLKTLKLDAISEKNGKLAVDEQQLMLEPHPDAYSDVSKEITITYSETDFILVIESWGQLSPQQITEAAFERLQKSLKAFTKLVKEV